MEGLVMANPTVEINRLALFSYKGAGNPIEKVYILDEETNEKVYVFTSAHLKPPLDQSRLDLVLSSWGNCS